MIRARLAILPLLAASALACAAAALAAPAAPPVPAAPGHDVVEQRWPDGTLRERRQVLVLPSGETIDDGPFRRWFVDGTLEYEAVFVLGKKEGTTVRYHRNGRVASRERYREGKRDGPSLSWNDSGEKVKEERWAAGLPHGTWTVWEDGRVAWTHTFVHGDPDP
jgi:hypothetical protein